LTRVLAKNLSFWDLKATKYDAEPIIK
jgi:hypothetical protein